MDYRLKYILDLLSVSLELFITLLQARLFLRQKVSDMTESNFEGGSYITSSVHSLILCFSPVFFTDHSSDDVIWITKPIYRLMSFVSTSTFLYYYWTAVRRRPFLDLDIRLMNGKTLSAVLSAVGSICFVPIMTPVYFVTSPTQDCHKIAGIFINKFCHIVSVSDHIGFHSICRRPRSKRGL